MSRFKVGDVYVFSLGEFGYIAKVIDMDNRSYFLHSHQFANRVLASLNTNARESIANIEHDKSAVKANKLYCAYYKIVNLFPRGAP